MKIKQLEWEDCAPTISSSVVSRAQALGYTFEVYLSDFYEKSAEDQPGYAISVNGKPLTWGHTSPRAWVTKEFAQLALQELFEARIREAIEEEQPAIPKAAEIQWDEIGFLSLCGRYEIWKDECGKLIPHFIQCGKRLQFTYGRDTIAEAQAACQPHKQKKMEEEYL